jgi:23S rRNA (cytosine1962-C5)-methyltransferase
LMIGVRVRKGVGRIMGSLKVILKKGRERALLRGHPWVFSGAVERIDGEASPGDEGEVYSREGEFLGLGHFNPRSQIILRILMRERGTLSDAFFDNRITAAAALRESWLKGKTDAYRLVNAEGDFLPGLVIDRYGRRYVVQFLTAGMDRWKDLVTQLLIRKFSPESIYERSDAPSRAEEGLSETRGLLSGEEVPEDVEIEECGCRFKVNVKGGQKTGFYLDQRENRSALRRLSEGKRVLDVFTYTGGFSIHAGRGGARELTLIDASEEALSAAEANLRLNRLEGTPHRLIRGDAFEVMRGLAGEYDIIILDPPPFAKKKGHLAGAARGYKDLNLLAFRLLKKGGLLFTFSCSHHVNLDLFQKIVFSAAVDAGKGVQVLGRRGQPVDHPFSLFHPEGEYLKGMICRVV